MEVPPERLVTWVVTFAERHGGATTDQPVTTGESGVAVTFTVTFTGADGATAECHPPFPPLPALVPGAMRAAAEALKDTLADFTINWVWMPPWGPESITEDGREQLRALGFNI